jgi:hypothetical protein
MARRRRGAGVPAGIDHDESVKVVQRRLGHASATETLDIYSHLCPDSEDRTRDAVDSVLAASCEPSVNQATPKTRFRRSEGVEDGR